jgi:hypothetical protein
MVSPAASKNRGYKSMICRRSSFYRNDESGQKKQKKKKQDLNPQPLSLA